MADLVDIRSEWALAQRAAEGDEASWREIYDATCDRLFAFLCYQVGSREEALDLMQETYLQAVRRLASYRGEAPIYVWLRMIALRKALDWKRAVAPRMRRFLALNESIAVPVEDDEHEIRLRSERVALVRALKTLSPQQRAVFLLREWEDWTFRQIAESIGCRENTARVHHARAKEKLRRVLEEKIPAPDAASFQEQRV